MTLSLEDRVNILESRVDKLQVELNSAQSGKDKVGVGRLARSPMMRACKLFCRKPSAYVRSTVRRFANDACLLSANLRDFEKVRGLRVENWLNA
jgi:hypothetical protein